MHTFIIQEDIYQISRLVIWSTLKKYKNSLVYFFN